MAAGQTLLIFTPQQNEPPAANYATLDTRNTTSPHLVLDFDTTTAEAAIFKAILPRNYAGGGITVYIIFACTSATTGTVGWTVEFEREQDGVDTLVTDSWASAQTITAVTVPGTAGIVKYCNVAVTNGANMDSIAVGEGFRIRIKRDVANDTAAGDAEWWGCELKES